MIAALLNPRVLTALAVAALIGLAMWRLNAWGDARFDAGVAKAQQACEAARIAAEQAQAKLDADNRAQAAAQSQAWEIENAAAHAALQTRQKELRHETANLAACRVDARALRVLNDAARAARSGKN